MYDLLDIALLALLVTIAWHWWRAQGFKHYALKRARQHCEQLHLQLLDETVVLRRLWPCRGFRVVEINLSPHRMP